MLRLVVVDGRDRGRTLAVDGSSASLGTSADNDLCLTDPYVSRRHGRVALQGNEWVYQDLESTNGSAIERDGRPHRLGTDNPTAALSNGTLIHVGETVLRVEIEGAAQASTAEQHTVIARRTLADLSEAQRKQSATPSSVPAAHALERRVAGASDAEEMLDVVLEGLLGAFPGATHAIVVLIDKKTGKPRRKVARVRGQEGRTPEDVTISMSIADRVIGAGESLLFNDAPSQFQASKSVVSAGIKSSLCAPLWTGSESVGLVQVETRRGSATFREEDLTRLGVFASKAALAIVASELAEAEGRSRQLQDLSARLIPSFIGKSEKPRPAGVRAMDASVLFSDIRGYTGTAERRSATDTLTMLNTYHSSVEDIVTGYGGTIVKTPGDAILAVFWKETQEGNHATCALKCGIAILDDLPRMARVWEDMGAQLRVGIGINAGQVAAGMTGRRHLEPTVVGDAVNVAQRLETITKSLECPVIFSESIRERVRGGFEVVSLGQVTVSGRETPLKIYTLARFAEAESP